MRGVLAALVLSILAGCSSVAHAPLALTHPTCEDPLSAWQTPPGYTLLYTATDPISLWIFYELTREEELEWPSRTIVRLDVYEPLDRDRDTLILAITTDDCVLGIYEISPRLRYMLGRLA